MDGRIRPYGQMLRDAAAKDHLATVVHAVTLRLWFNDGRRSQAFPWVLYTGDTWEDQPGKPERVTLSFGDNVITVLGYNLRKLLEAIDDGVLRQITEHNSQEAELMRREGSAATPHEAPTVVTRLEVKESDARNGA